jgi:hypothetical protein
MIRETTKPNTVALEVKDDFQTGNWEPISNSL